MCPTLFLGDGTVLEDAKACAAQSGRTKIIAARAAVWSDLKQLSLTVTQRYKWSSIRAKLGGRVDTGGVSAAFGLGVRPKVQKRKKKVEL